MVTFLIVDDLEANLIALDALLRRDGVRILQANSGAAALELLLEHEVALAIVDVQMPEMDGFQLAEIMRSTERTRAVPIIFVTAGATDALRHFRGYDLGAVDFLFKPIDTHMLRSKADVFYSLAVQREQLRALLAEQKRRAEEKSGAEQFLRAMMDGAHDLIYAVDPEGRVLFCNHGAARVWGATPEAVRGRSEAECWHEAGKPGAARAVEFTAAVVRTGETLQVEIAMETPGARIVYWLDKAPMRTGDGTIAGVVTTAKDVSELAATREALASERATLEALLHASPAGLLMTDRQGAVIRMNAAAHALWGTPPSTRSVSDFTLWKGWWADNSEKHGRRISTDEWTAARVLRGETRTSDIIEIEPFDAPGTRRTVINAGAPVLDRHGQIIGAVVAETDITDLRRISDALAASEQKARQQLSEIEAIYQSAPLGMAVLDLDLVFLRVNDRLAGINGLPASAHIGRCVAELLPAFLDVAIVTREKMLSTGGVVRTELVGQTASEPGVERVWDELWYPMRDASGRISQVGVIVQDITERRRMERELQEAQERIRQHAETLERTVEERTAKLRESIVELESFSYSMAHDMRGPLRTMIGYSEVLEEENAHLDEKSRHYLERIRIGATRLDRLTQEVLSYTRVVNRELPVEAVEFPALLREMIETYPDLRAGQEHIEIAPDLPVVLGNPAALTQVFSNLLGNALKFVEAGRTPEVRIWSENGLHVGNEPGYRVRIWVEDRGIGIPQAARPRLFQLFQRFTTDPSYSGVGMGLAIARKAVEKMHGSIGMEPREGGGTRFWVILPQAG